MNETTPPKTGVKTYRREYVIGLNAVGFHGVAYVCSSPEGRERILIGPNVDTAYLDAVALFGDFMRKDLCREVVVITPQLFKDLLERAHLKTDILPPEVPGAPKPRPELKPVPYIGKRRRQVFEEAGGKCHYCGCELELHGKWHVEHKMPKALGGGDEPINLTAACIPCNRKKRDKTDLEFKAQLAKEQSK